MTQRNFKNIDNSDLTVYSQIGTSADNINNDSTDYTVVEQKMKELQDSMDNKLNQAIFDRKRRTEEIKDEVTSQMAPVLSTLTHIKDTLQNNKNDFQREFDKLDKKTDEIKKSIDSFTTQHRSEHRDDRKCIIVTGITLGITLLLPTLGAWWQLNNEITNLKIIIGVEQKATETNQLETNKALTPNKTVDMPSNANVKTKHK